MVVQSHCIIGIQELTKEHEQFYRRGREVSQLFSIPD